MHDLITRVELFLYFSSLHYVSLPSQNLIIHANRKNEYFQHMIIVVFTAKISESIFGVHCKKRSKKVWMYAKCTLKIQMNIHRHYFARDSLEKLISKHTELNRKKKSFLDQALHSLFVHNALVLLPQRSHRADNVRNPAVCCSQTRFILTDVTSKQKLQVEFGTG